MKALVIGIGRMGRFHVRTLSDLGLDVVTLDTDLSINADYVSLPPRAFDVVCVATPIKMLAETAATWAPHASTMLIEKPMAQNVNEALALVRHLRNTTVGVGYVERFNPAVIDLAQRLKGARSSSAHFTRWNLRPTTNVDLDLRTHDLDLASHLKVGAATFDTRADMPRLVRTIDVQHDGEYVRADLLAHATSPLYAQWCSLLAGKPGFATPADGVHVLQQLELTAVEEVA